MIFVCFEPAKKCSYAFHSNSTNASDSFTGLFTIWTRWKRDKWLVHGITKYTGCWITYIYINKTLKLHNTFYSLMITTIPFIMRESFHERDLALCTEVLKRSTCSPSFPANKPLGWGCSSTFFLLRVLLRCWEWLREKSQYFWR